MKKYLKHIAAGMAMAVACSSCIDLEQMNEDPNNATSTDPGLLLTGIAFNLGSTGNNGRGMLNADPFFAAKMQILTSGESQYQVYKWTRDDFDYYNNLRDITKMQEEALKGNQTVYNALALFFQAHYFYALTMHFGDIPCSDALKGESNQVYQPKYDSQENVFSTILIDLEEANNLLKNNSGSLTGDIIYGGDLMKWRRLINSYRLRVLMSLSHKNAVGNLNIKSAFAQVVQNEPLMSSAADNGQIVFLDQQDNRYPFFNDSDFGSGRFMDSTYVAALKIRKDPRLFAIATQTPNAAKAGLAITDFSAYDGGDPAIAYSLVNDKATAGDCSKPATRYYQSPTNEPIVIMGYTEQQLILAEAVVRGWITGDDKAYYESAVKASFKFFETYAKGYSEYVTAEAADIYLKGENVVYASSQTQEQKIERIIMQKYLPSYLQGSMWLPYYEQLRTGYPEFRHAAGISLPYRWMYPQDEYNNNATNVQAALQSQFGGSDKTSNKPWWLQ